MGTNVDLRSRTDRIAQLLEDRLDIRGAGFEAKLKRAGRLLPRHLRREGDKLRQALALTAHPRLERQLDTSQLAKSADAIERYLLDLDAWDRRRGIAVNVSASVVFNLLVVMALIVGVLLWRGLL